MAAGARCGVYGCLMRGAEVRAVGELAGEALAGAGVLVRDVHAAVARRAFEAVGPSAAPARAVHDGISAAVHDGVRAALAALPRGAGAALAASAASDAPALADSPRGALALAALNAAKGDVLADGGSPLALGMALRRRGADLDAEAIAHPSGRVAIFVHGLGETDRAWRLRATPERPGYGVQLERDLGYTSLELRYNTGRHISDNGRALAVLLEDLHAAWPTRPDEIVVVGHSMGGLVARSACHYGHQAHHAWINAVRHVVCLGSPHLGAPLEKGVNALGWALSRIPETAPFARVVNGRSAGIKDLRFGACVEEDWCDCDPDELLTDRCRDVPFLTGATFSFIAATVRGEPIGTIVGDLLVRVPSASGTGRRRRIPFVEEQGRHLTGLNHLDLLNHPAVYEQLRAWLAP
jgi:pimeloyl-ACP methyl ester carboxylesterase